MAERVSDISANLDSQLKKKVKSFVIFSVALDETRTFRTLHNKPYLFVA